MSSIQRRAKNVYQIPLIHLTEQKTQSTTTVMDPRSPSANVTRTPVDLKTYQLPNAPNIHIK